MHKSAQNSHQKFLNDKNTQGAAISLGYFCHIFIIIKKFAIGTGGSRNQGQSAKPG